MSAMPRDRDIVTSRRVLLRLILALGILSAFSGIWRLGRPAIVAQLARSSVGCPGRGPLIAAGLRLEGHSLPSDRRLFDWPDSYEDLDLRSHSEPRPGWVAWYEWEQSTAAPGGSTLWKTLRFADADLRPRGVLTWNTDDVHIDSDPLAAAPGDYDGDGLWECLLSLRATHDRGLEPGFGYAVVRAGDARTELCAYILVDTPVFSQRRSSIGVTWQDVDGDGSTELVLYSQRYWFDADRRFHTEPNQTRAVLAWTRPGGVLVPIVLPEEGGVYVTTPDPAGPAAVPAGEDIAPLLRRFRPTIRGSRQE